VVAFEDSGSKPGSANNQQNQSGRFRLNPESAAFFPLAANSHNKLTAKD